ncbi:hypothetical protein MTR_7g445280 [Medicago truncatula]|uniref:Uncharacterized protein n=1 Tax=Medicago truncatula TaxID=3880 RepID=A0A072TZT7_MEDTR|nr:hypothetical protein MTR_7g445280 [Medicago truncatula]
MAQRPQLKQLIKIQSRKIFNINHNNYVTHGKQVKIPIPLCIRVTLRRHLNDNDNATSTTSTRQCNYNFLIMHVVPTRASSPQHIELKYTHRALSPQLKEQIGSHDIKPST